jgi:GT2 family glycosyltransferase
LNLNFSIIIAVYQRRNELIELLQSLANQSDKDFEVVVVDDGSPEKLENLTNSFIAQLDIQYHYKENSGASASRNFGMEKASGNYFIFLDSDTIAPKNYIETVRKELNSNYVDAFGGPDSAKDNFTDLQKAISFSMTSFLTTGGIRGGKKHVGKFQPRSFNMGISKIAFEKTGGFGNLRIGEDPDLSMTLWENGFETQLIPDAFVYHKRRASLKKFAKQVYNFGIARPILNQRHPKFTKLTFWFPAFILFYIMFALLGFIYSILNFQLIDFHIFNKLIRINSLNYLLMLVFPLKLYFLLIWVFAAVQTKSIKTGFLAMLTSLTQFCCYGYGFLKSWISLNIFRFKPEKIFPNHFSRNV